ncbi:zinc finger protein 839 [Discoglossus pictus]
MADSEGPELGPPAVAAEEICESEQDEEPSRVRGLSEEIIRSLAQTGSVYYVQPDGSLVQGGSLGMAQGGSLGMAQGGSLGMAQGGGLGMAQGGGLGMAQGGGLGLAQGGNLGLVQGGGLELETGASPGVSVQTAAQRRQAGTQSSSISRMFNHKHLKSICVQVPGLGTKIHKEPEVHPIYSTLSTETLNLHGAQILQIGQLSEHGHQRIFLHSSSLENPTTGPISVPASALTLVPTLAPAPIPTVALGPAPILAPVSAPISAPVPVPVTAPIPAPVPVTAMAEQPPKQPEYITGASSQNMVSTMSVVSKETSDPSPPIDIAADDNDSYHSEISPKDDQKAKKTLKIKTRSGRVSRPPKHKAKDYKFIRMGDLAFGHQSDSDDYSELSVGEDEDVTETVSFDTQSYNLKPKLFHCDTCDKSYIGRGGLSRHYKLFPDHGQLASLEKQIISVKTTNGQLHFEFADTGDSLVDAGASNASMEDCDAPSTANTEEPAESVPNQQTITTNVESSAPDIQQAVKSSSLNEDPPRCEENETPKLTKRRGRPRIAEKSTEKRKRPKKILRALSPEESEIKRRGHLRELLKQFRIDDLKDMVLPRLTKLVTVYEFLLLKIEQECQNEATFPRVYTEFEQLHCMVKVMARDYLDNMAQTTDKTLQIKQNKVAESLGIPQEIIKRHKPTGRASASDKLLQSMKPNPSEKEMSPPVKKLRMDVTDGLSTGAPDMSGTHNEMEKTSDLCAEGGSIISDSEMTEISNEFPKCETREKDPSKLEGKKQVASSNPVFYQNLAKSSLQSPGKRKLSAARSSNHEDVLNVHKFVENFVNKRSEIVPGLSSSLLFPETANYVCTQTTSEPIKSGHCLESSGHPNPEKKLHAEQTLSTKVILDHTYRAGKGSTQVPTAAPGAAINLQGTFLDVKPDPETKFLDQHATTIEVTSDNHGLFTQANEQIYYQTSDGLLLPHSAIAGITQQDSIVILTDTGGSAVHFGTVEALLQMETK